MSEPIALEDLLVSQLPSALFRNDAALASQGFETNEIRATKEAVAALAGLASVPQVPPSSLRDRIVFSSSRRGRYGLFADRIARLFDIAVEDAATLLARMETPDAWAPFLVAGVDMIPVEAGPRCKGAIATLVRFQPGVTFPEHVHRGVETMLVLEGGFREAAASGVAPEEAWRGDELYRADGSAHALVTLEGVPCIAASLVVGYADFR